MDKRKAEIERVLRDLMTALGLSTKTQMAEFCGYPPGSAAARQWAQDGNIPYRAQVEFERRSSELNIELPASYWMYVASARKRSAA